MNFPVVFRIYAVINLLAFLAFAALTVVLTTAGANFGLISLSIHWTITIWLFVSAISWFFASKSSYHFLFSLSFLLLAVAISWITTLFFSDAVQSRNDAIWFMVVTGCCIFYLIFLVVAAFYKPVVDWTTSRWSLKHHGIMLILLFIITAGFFTFGKMSRRMTELGITYSLYSNGAYENYPVKIAGNEWLKVEFTGITSVNTLVVPVDTTNEAYPLKFAKLFYSDSADFDYKVAPSRIIEFKEKDDQWVAEFPELTARVLQIFPMENESTHANPQTTFSIAGISPMWMYGYFDKRTPTVVVDDPAYGEYAGYEYDNGIEGEDPGTPEGNGRELTSSNLIEFYTALIQNSSFFNSTWMFSEKTEKLTLNDGQESRAFGMYSQGIGQLWFCFGYNVKNFREYSDFDYERFVTELSGNSVYSSHARGYDYDGNGTAFNHLNPSIIAWAEENLILDPDANILGYSAKEYYDVMFKRFMRMMVYSHEYLEQIGIDNELEMYVSASQKENFYGPEYIMNRYASLPFDEHVHDSEWKDGSDFVGFWLRRKHDGTYDQCWNALVKIMGTYDNNWFEQHEAEMQGLLNSEGH